MGENYKHVPKWMDNFTEWETEVKAWARLVKLDKKELGTAIALSLPILTEGYETARSCV